jgi:hypothetical protein
MDLRDLQIRENALQIVELEMARFRKLVDTDQLAWKQWTYFRELTKLYLLMCKDAREQAAVGNEDTSGYTDEQLMELLLKLTESKGDNKCSTPSLQSIGGKG